VYGGAQSFFGELAILSSHHLVYLRILLGNSEMV